MLSQSGRRYRVAAGGDRFRITVQVRYQGNLQRARDRKGPLNQNKIWGSLSILLSFICYPSPPMRQQPKRKLLNAQTLFRSHIRCPGAAVDVVGSGRVRNGRGTGRGNATSIKHYSLLSSVTTCTRQDAGAKERSIRNRRGGFRSPDCTAGAKRASGRLSLNRTG
jgi:hypothetical protein